MIYLTFKEFMLALHGVVIIKGVYGYFGKVKYKCNWSALRISIFMWKCLTLSCLLLLCYLLFMVAVMEGKEERYDMTCLHLKSTLLG